MRIPLLARASLVLLSAAGLSACGGGGNPFSVPSQDISMSGAVLPLTLSGQSVNYVIPITGGCGGPYVLSVIAGSMPPGLSLNNATHSISGIVLLPGNYTFTIQIDDTGCTPFATVTQQFTWLIDVGPVAIVACTPAIIPVADYHPLFTTPFPDCDALRTTVYGGVATFNFTIAGGVPPYTLDVVDDPNDPLDANWGPAAMPQGVTIPPFSASMVGSPTQTNGSIPFRFTFRITDSTASVGFRKLQWKVDTPPIVIATTTLPNGKCGSSYSESIQIVDGVPPFRFEFTALPATVDVWQSPLAPLLLPNTITVDQVTGAANNKISAANYPAQNVAGPYTGIVPEGIFLRELTGAISGVPRRQGAFTFHMHVRSALVPNDFGQHAWQTYTASFANSEPPIVPTPAYSYGSLNTWTIEGTLLGAAPYSTIPEIERGVPYNPDGGTAGLAFIAQGGVPKDGKTDGPHFSQVADIDGTSPALEYAGGYTWTIDWDPFLLGTTPPVGVSFAGHTGILSVPDPSLLGARGRTLLGFVTLDEQLPSGNRHQISGNVAYSIGPDRVIITESTRGDTFLVPTTGANNSEQTVRVLEPLSSGVIFRDLDNATDLTPQGIPGTTATADVKDLLTLVDLMRVSINPTGWWDDVHGLNPGGGRPFQGSDMNKSAGYYGAAYDDGNYQAWNADASHVRLPSTTGATANQGLGVYTDGGKLYGFENDDTFGVFIVRPDSRIYLPVAIDKSSGFTGFGDGVLQSKPSTGGTPVHSVLRIAQMTISPNGRFAAMKLKTNGNSGGAAFDEDASTTKIILFTLSGETLFGGSHYTIIDTGSDGSQNQGVYQYAGSLALTNSYLYYLCGNHLNEFSSWREHGIYRYELVSGNSAGGLLEPGFSAAWVNDGSSPSTLMQTPFHAMDNPVTTQQVFLPSGTFAFTDVLSQEMYAYDGWNVLENSVAPMPFRVSRNGEACAILAGLETGNQYADTNNMNHHVWVDHNGTLRQVDTTRRHSPQGGARGYSLSRGPSNYKHWGAFCGPTTGFEISDNATKIAVVVNRQSAAVDPQSYIWYGDYNWRGYRQDIVAFTTTDSWANATPVQVTGTESAATPKFAGSYLWRFGALTFTADNAGLVFWAGYNSQYNPPPALATDNSGQLSGTFYSWNFSSSQLNSCIPTASGGSNSGVATFAGSVNPTFGSLSGSQGRLRPTGGFISRNRHFLYIVTHAAVSGSDATNNTLIGINIRSLNAANNINTRPDGQGFKVVGQTGMRGFLATYDVDPYYCFEQRLYAPAHTAGFGGQVLAKDSGYVFFASHYQPYTYQSLPFASGYPTFQTQAGPDNYSGYGDYAAWSGQVEGFSADVGGPVARMTQTSLAQGDGTTGRPIHHIICSDDGKTLAFVYDTGGNIEHNMSAESVGFVQRIGFDAASGALQTGKVEWASTLSGGRAGDAMALDSRSLRLYVPFGVVSNENTKTVREVRFNPAGAGTFSASSLGAAKRYNVLHSGR